MRRNGEVACIDSGAKIRDPTCRRIPFGAIQCRANGSRAARIENPEEEVQKWSVRQDCRNACLQNANLTSLEAPLTELLAVQNDFCRQ